MRLVRIKTGQRRFGSAKLPTRSRNLLSLPDEVLVKVFSFIKPKDVFISLYPVCSRFRYIVKHLMYCYSLNLDWLNVDHGNRPKKIASFLKFLQDRPNLKSLSCNNNVYADGEKILETLASYCPKLEHLAVPHIYVSEETFKVLLQACKNLKTLIVERNVAKEMFNILAIYKVSDLATLRVHAFPNGNYGVINNYNSFGFISRLSSLESLSLSIEDFESDQLLSLRNLQNLKHFKLHCHRDTPDSTSSFIQQRCADLTYLFDTDAFRNLESLSIYRHQGGNTQTIKTIAKNCKNLKDLNISRLATNDKALEYLFYTHRKLETLSVSCIPITGSCFGVKVLSSHKLRRVAIATCGSCKKDTLLRASTINENISYVYKEKGFTGVYRCYVYRNGRNVVSK